jgi:signal transduction histidine kinase
VRLAATRGPGAVLISVADDGPGLPAEDRARAGERFFRADSARSTPGSGLGLSLVRAVAALHGGQVMLDDAHPGAERPGLRATLRLPAG